MSNPKIVLRYFDIAGRAQPLRHALLNADLPFHDQRLSIEQWHVGMVDADAAGPYRGLPTLSWGDVTVSETLAIASFLGRELGEYTGLESAEIARREAVCSNCYLELIVRVGELLWCDYMYPGASPSRALATLAPRMLAKVSGVEAQLQAEWLCGARPGMADYFAAEGLRALRGALGSARDGALMALLPRLFDHSDRLRRSPQLAIAERTRPAAFTGRPDEAAVLAALAATDLSAHSL
jgi:glutathione S-transferase